MTPPSPTRGAAGALRPARAGLAAALACVCDLGMGAAEGVVESGAEGVVITIAHCGITDPGEAWEALATRGVIPLAWVGDERRQFAPLDPPCECAPRRSRPSVASYRFCVACGHVAAQPHPPTVAACVALASDVAGVTQAEALARECVARLAPWGAPQPQRIVWRMLRDGERGTIDATRANWTTHPHRSLMNAAAIIRGGDDGIDTTRPPHVQHAEWSEAWDQRRQQLRLAEGVRPNPFAPLVELWALGYALDAIDDDAVTLVCPAL